MYTVQKFIPTFAHYENLAEVLKLRYRTQCTTLTGSNWQMVKPSICITAKLLRHYTNPNYHYGYGSGRDVESEILKIQKNILEKGRGRI